MIKDFILMKQLRIWTFSISFDFFFLIFLKINLKDFFYNIFWSYSSPFPNSSPVSLPI